MQHKDQGDVSKGQSARRTLGGGSVRTYGVVSVERAACDGQIGIVAIAVDGTTVERGVVSVERAARDCQMADIVVDGTTIIGGAVVERAVRDGQIAIVVK